MIPHQRGALTSGEAAFRGYDQGRKLNVLNLRADSNGFDAVILIPDA